VKKTTIISTRGQEWVGIYLGKWQEHKLSSFSLSNLKTHKALTLGGYREPGVE
jgi:hypothetical protein